MRQPLGRFKLRKVLVNGKDIVYHGPLLVLKETAGYTEATTVGTAAQEKPILSILEVHVEGRAEALVSLLCSLT